MGALDDVNSFEVETFLEEHGLDLAVQNDSFKPSSFQSKEFADATKDTNPIHRKIEGFDEVISPGFLQNCAAIVLSRRAMAAIGLSSVDFPYSLNESEMPGPVATGLDYFISARFNAHKREADVEVRNLQGGLLYSLHRIIHRERPTCEMPGIDEELVYEGRFAISGEDSVSAFGSLVGSKSSESNLRALAGSSSAVCDAISAGKLNPLEAGVVAMYAGKQNFYLDASRTLDLHKGINMRLYVSEKDKFGRLSAKNDYVRMSVVGEDDSGRMLYHFNAGLSFQDERIVPLMLRKALKNKGLVLK
jgi:hypothetical protein